MARHISYVCGDTDCPNDPAFEHRFYYGCVPRDFSDQTGRSRTRRQTATAVDGLPWKLHLWDGGCDATGVTAQQRLEAHRRAVKRGTPTIMLNMKPTRREQT